MEGVLDHVSANGSSARIVVEESANETQVGQYRQLQEQLDGGKLVWLFSLYFNCIVSTHSLYF